MRCVYMVIRNVTWDMCTGLSEMQHEICVHGYPKCDMRYVYSFIRNVTYVYSFIRNVTWDVYKFIRNVTWDVHRVLRNETWDMCTGFSEIWHETSLQGYLKCDMRHVYMVIRNVTWDVYRFIRNLTRHLYRVMRNVTWYMCTGSSEMWHETCVQSYQKCDLRHVYRYIRNH